jgi:hypothetical protein
MFTPTKAAPRAGWRRGCLGQQFLAGAGFAQQQHGGAVGLRHPPRLAFDLQRRRAAADEAGDGVAGRRASANLAARGVQFALQAAELADQRLHGGLRVVQQHQAHGADDLPWPSRSGSRLTRKVPAWLVSRSTRMACHFHHLAHQGVGHHLLDPAADEVALGVAQRRQEAPVAVVIQTMRCARSTTIMPCEACASRSNMDCAASFRTASASCGRAGAAAGCVRTERDDLDGGAGGGSGESSWRGAGMAATQGRQARRCVPDCSVRGLLRCSEGGARAASHRQSTVSGAHCTSVDWRWGGNLRPRRGVFSGSRSGRCHSPKDPAAQLDRAAGPALPAASSGWPPVPAHNPATRHAGHCAAQWAGVAAGVSGTWIVLAHNQRRWAVTRFVEL